MMTAKKKQRGRSPRTMDKVLFIRVSRELVEALDRCVAAETETHPGRTISRADVVRETLMRALAEATCRR